VLPVAPLLAETIMNVFADDSVSAIFGGENQLFWWERLNQAVGPFFLPALSTGRRGKALPFHVEVYAGEFFGSYEFDLTADELQARIVAPYHAGKTLVIGGNIIPAESIQSIRIAETEQLSAQLRPHAEARARSQGAFVSASSQILAGGTDRTRDFITGGPGSGTATILEPMAVDQIVTLCERFPRFVRGLRHRRAQKEPVEIGDEYDLQYLVGALLALHYDDVRPEEWTPSYAGGSSRVDFLVKAEKVILELKHTRDGLDDKQIGKELIEDIAHYAGSGDCDHLVCFVYDPGHRLRNPAGLISDLEKRPPEGLGVRVVIEPR